MIHKFVRCCLTAALLGSTSVMALEVGEIQVQSALNQLFDARIPLPSLTPEQLAGVSVKLAPPAMFKEFGLDQTPTLKHLVFSLQYDADGQVYVKVVSTQPVREPSLGLLLEFGWPRGRTFREYTVLLDPVRRLAARPHDRTRTILDPPVGDKPAAAPAAEDSGVIAETADWTGEWWFPPGTPLAATGGYQPGETYGPVAPGEGLWGIALKVRPDPNITREQMMQALFQANPQAFTSVGVDGLRSGVMLRIPSFQEIADFSGSVAARQRAEAERSATLAAADSAASKPVAARRLADGDLQVFPLPPPPVLEPTTVETPPSVIPDEPVKADPEPVEPEPEPEPAPEPEPEPEPELEPVVAEKSEPASEPAPVAAVEPESEHEPESEPAPVAQLQIELPVSATPLLLIAVSEMMASLTRIPTILELKLMDPVLLAGSMDVNQTPHLNPSLQQGTAHCETPGCLAPYPLRGGGWGVRVANHESARVVVEGVEWLVAVERRIPQAGFDWLVLPGEPPWAKPVAGSLEGLDSAARTVEADRENVSAKVVDSATLVAEEGGQYGPVAPNERLWTIADKLRPDPSINTPTMMQALFVANPQAFSQGDMNFLKVDAILRIPTLREIVEYTGSRAAQQLLELDQQNKALPAPANGEEVGSE